MINLFLNSFKDFGIGVYLGIKSFPPLNNALHLIILNVINIKAVKKLYFLRHSIEYFEQVGLYMHCSPNILDKVFW
ncbi:conserved hypothetical protein [Borreliella bissettiae DN127]|uniref:Uncharacterized protein n=1 Tax=Borrelia bissettiae (strain DSM 17990 / CIP 109136 / DN127) TaxID=521010 RepID=G0AKV4_BORBD|nr:conserved hypothetical protein [Borreliella bissettiae DN127]